MNEHGIKLGLPLLNPWLQHLSHCRAQTGRFHHTWNEDNNSFVSRKPDEHLVAAKNFEVLKDRKILKKKQPEVLLSEWMQRHLALIPGFFFLLCRGTKPNLTLSISHFHDPVMHPLFPALLQISKQLWFNYSSLHLSNTSTVLVPQTEVKDVALGQKLNTSPCTLGRSETQ